MFFIAPDVVVAAVVTIGVGIDVTLAFFITAGVVGAMVVSRGVSIVVGVDV
jgi:hypothetical protein